MRDEIVIDVSDIVQYFYCPRKVYFMKVMGIRVERKRMEDGKNIHEEEYKKTKRRKFIFGFSAETVDRVECGVFMENYELGLKGKVDTLIFLKNGEIIPLDMKHTRFKRIFLQWKKQIVAYSLLVDHWFETKVKRGIIYLIPVKKPVEVEITPKDKQILIKELDRIREIILSESFPRVGKGKRCEYCEMREFC